MCDLVVRAGGVLEVNAGCLGVGGMRKVKHGRTSGSTEAG